MVPKAQGFWGKHEEGIEKQDSKEEARWAARALSISWETCWLVPGIGEDVEEFIH